MKVSLISGVYVLPDAISYAVHVKVQALKELWGEDLQYRVYCYNANVSDPNVRIVKGSADLSEDEFFLNSDLVMFEFGIYSDLFNAIFLLGPRTRKVVVWHNITPRHLLKDPGAVEATKRGFAQRANILQAQHVFSDSAYNSSDLVEYGIDPAMIDVLQLPLKPSFPYVTHRSREPRSVVEALFVGRFVPSKGLLDCVEAVCEALDSGVPIRLTLVGSLDFSDTAYLARVRQAIAQSRYADRFVFAGPVTEDELARWYRNSDIFLIASYHEGFGVPVIEALASGCVPVGYDAGALPDTAAGLGRLVPTGDKAALAGALSEVGRALLRPDAPLPLDGGPLTRQKFSDKVASYISSYTYEAFYHRFEYLLRDRLGLRAPRFRPFLPPEDASRRRRGFVFCAAAQLAGGRSQCVVDVRALQRRERSPAADSLWNLIRHRPDRVALTGLVSSELPPLAAMHTRLLATRADVTDLPPDEPFVFVSFDRESARGPIEPWLEAPGCFRVGLLDAGRRSDPEVAFLHRFHRVLPHAPVDGTFGRLMANLPPQRVGPRCGFATPAADEVSPRQRRDFVVFGGHAGSRVESAVLAFREHKAGNPDGGARLLIAGRYSETLRGELRRLAGNCASEIECLEGPVSDAVVASALAGIAPSDSPECWQGSCQAIAVGTPVLATRQYTAGAPALHECATFEEGDVAAIARAMSCVAGSGLDAVLRAQQELASFLAPSAVAARVWTSILPSLPMSRKVAPGFRLFWPSAGKSPESAAVSASLVDLMADGASVGRVVFVIDNSRESLAALQAARESSGAVLFRETYLPELWRAGAVQDALPDDKFRLLELHSGDPLYFIRPLLKGIGPVIVQSKALLRLLHAEGCEAHFAPCFWRSHDRLAAGDRTALSRTPNSFLIGSFGALSRETGMEALLMAVDLLRKWNIPAEACICAEPGEDPGPALHWANELGIGSLITIVPAGASAAAQLAHADAAVELRLLGLGQPSPALADWIAAEVPAVANENLAESCEAPASVLRVPNSPSYLLLAEQLAAIRNRDRRAAPHSVRSWVMSHRIASFASSLTRIAEAL